MAQITTETARSFAVLAVQARKRYAAERAVKASQEPTPKQQPEPAPVTTGHDAFTLARLARIRKQLVRIDGLLADTVEPKALKELAEALARLQVQEERLAGRPGPGNLRPRTPRDDRQRLVAPVIEPEPIVASPAPPQAPSTPPVVAEILQKTTSAEPPSVQ